MLQSQQLETLERNRKGIQLLERVVKLCCILDCSVEDLIKYIESNISKMTKLLDDFCLSHFARSLLRRLGSLYCLSTLGVGASSFAAYAAPLPTPPQIPTSNPVQQQRRFFPLPASSPLELPSTPPAQTPTPERGTIVVTQFRYQGNTVFSSKRLDKVTKGFLNRPLSFADLVAVRTAITDVYVAAGYVTSGAIVAIDSNQSVSPNGGVVTLQIIEGTIEQINVSGSPQLNRYVQRRLIWATRGLLNEPQLQEALRLLQLDPLIQSISGELSPSTTPGQSLLKVVVRANPATTLDVEVANGRSPTIGSLEQRVTLSQANLLGLGDTLALSYRRTEGSNNGDFSYTIPVSPQNATVGIRYSFLPSRIVQKPFDELDIKTQSRVFELSLKQPLIRRATADHNEEFAIGLTASKILSDAQLLDTPFPLSRGADDQGRTRITALQFFQEYTSRSQQQVLVARSQLSIGLNALDSTINSDAPDSRFVIWRGQLEWLRRLGTRNYLVLRSGLQLSDRPLVSIEQFSIGGSNSVRGFSQNALLGDNGVNGSLELHLPIINFQQHQIQFFPFVDVGYVWNRGQGKSSQTLAAIGLGVQWNWGNLSTQLTYGLPLTQTQNLVDYQLQHFNFSIRYGISF